MLTGISDFDVVRMRSVLSSALEVVVSNLQCGRRHANQDDVVKYKRGVGRLWFSYRCAKWVHKMERRNADWKKRNFQTWSSLNRTGLLQPAAQRDRWRA